MTPSYPTLKSTQAQLNSKEISAQSLAKETLAKMEKQKELNAYLHWDEEYTLSQAAKADELRNKGADLALLGVPIAIKDNIVDTVGPTSCASKMLEKFESVYEATVVKKLKAAGAVIVGKTNLDEFAMGSSTENSAFGPSLNPLDKNHIAGGSSGGSAVAVASGSVPISLGSDTGGSIRQPAACCGIVGLKPTYGRVSRYGLVAFASSLDQIGPMAHSVEDCARVLNVIAGEDPMDQTSSMQPVPDFTALLNKDIAGKVIGIPKETFHEGVSPEIRDSVLNRISELEKKGAKVEHISLPHMDYGVAAYYIIATAEASANLSRYDGVRYTRRAEGAESIQELYAKSRSEGFGQEVKRRIMLGTYVLSSGFYDAYYSKAQKIRRLIKNDFTEAFKSCDVIVTPTMPHLPARLGEYQKDPLAAYLADIYTVSLNLAGLPGIALPLDKVGSLYTNMQLIGKPFEEDKLLQIASAVENT